MSGNLKISDIEGDELNVVGNNSDIPILSLSINGDANVSNTNTEEFVVNIPGGWSNIGFPFDLSTVTKIEYRDHDGSFISEQTNISTQDVYFYYKPSTGVYYITDSVNQTHVNNGFSVDAHTTIDVEIIFGGLVAANNLIIAKNYLGEAYIPQFGFNGIPGPSKYQGLQIKTNNACQLVFTAARNSKIVDGSIQYGSEYKIGEKWSIINFGNKHPLNIEELCQTFVEDVIIVKRFDGTAYLPQWNFNGLGELQPGESYQIKTSDDFFVELFFPENE